MSLCGVSKFSITKNIDNTFVFTIKANGSTLPIVIDPSDTFTAKLRNLSDGAIVLSKALTITDAPSGKVSLTLTASETANLTALRGSPEDRYYTRPSYSLIMECSTVSNGVFTVKVEYVYID